MASGFKSNLPDILSAIARVQLKKADILDAKRKVHVKKYNDAFSKMDFVKIPPTSEGDAHDIFLQFLSLPE